MNFIKENRQQKQVYINQGTHGCLRIFLMKTLSLKYKRFKMLAKIAKN